MSYQVLARKLRPKKFCDVIGQNHIVKSLTNSIIRKSFGHAYLLAGTRGVGKTTIARILAKALRCENRESTGDACNQCPSCKDFSTQNSMNIIEIDGASNNSVDDIRELISNIQYLPTIGEYKVYIIDEVHMLSTSAFNALLKTLEEPPKHVVFIFATTVPEKLLPTVLSRCQRFDFKTVSKDDLVSFIENISNKEGITFESKDIIKEICIQGDGSVRDTLSLLDQVLCYSNDNNINEENLVVALGIARTSSISKIITSIFEGNTDDLTKVFNTLLKDNVSVKNIITPILEYIFSLIELANTGETETVVNQNIINEMNKMTKAELFWIYETIAKDSLWVMDSIVADKSALLMLQKVALRKSFFKQSELIEKKNEVIVDDSNDEVRPEKEEKKVKIEIPKTWDGFLNFLAEHSPAQASNLEQGNIIKPLVHQDGTVNVDLGFGQAEKVFLDYLNESEINKKLVQKIAEFFEIEINQVSLKLVLVDDSLKEEFNFQSKAEIIEIENNKLKEENESLLRGDPIINEAEDLFSAKVDKVIVNVRK